MTATNRASAVMAADPDDVFATLTDIAHLPDWNDAMTEVVEQPERLEVGAEWVVEFHALTQTWRSRSTVEELEPASRRFAYRSATDDGNPSDARWTWEVAEAPAGSEVTVSWELHPATFWRKLLLVRIRARQLGRTEVPASLTALATTVANPS